MTELRTFRAKHDLTHKATRSTLGWLDQKVSKIKALPIWHTPSPATWRSQTGATLGFSGRPLRSFVPLLTGISNPAPKPRVSTVLLPPPTRRGSEPTSGTPSGMMA